MALETLSAQLDEEKISKLIDRTDKNFTLIKIGLLEELSLEILGHAKIGSIVGKHQFSRDVYVFNCEKHGLQISLPSGWSNKLLCNSCISEIKAEFAEIRKIKEDEENLMAKAKKTKTDLNKYRSNNQNLK